MISMMMGNSLFTMMSTFNYVRKNKITKKGKMFVNKLIFYIFVKDN